VAERRSSGRAHAGAQAAAAFDASLVAERERYHLEIGRWSLRKRVDISAHCGRVSFY
jgi:hypothetical protein